MSEALVIKYAKCMCHVVSSMAFLAVQHFSTLSQKQNDFHKKKMSSNILYAVTSFGENHFVFEIMWKNAAEPERPHALCMLDD